MDDPHIERTTDEARAGATPGIVRWVLLISISLAVVALGLIAVIGMETRDRYPPPPQETPTAQPSTAQPSAAQSSSGQSSSGQSSSGQSSFGRPA